MLRSSTKRPFARGIVRRGAAGGAGGGAGGARSGERGAPRIGTGVAGAADGADDVVRDRVLEDLRRHDEVGADVAAHALRHRRREVQQRRIGTDVELPGQVDECEALPQVPLVRILVADEETAAAVDDVDVDDAVAAVLRPDDVDVAGEFDFAAGVARRLVEVGDHGVVRVRRIDGVVDPAADALVVVRVVAAGEDLEAVDAGERGDRECRMQDAKCRNELHSAFAILHSAFLYIPPAVMARAGVTRRRSPGWSVCDAGSSLRSRSSSTVTPNFFAIEYQVSPLRTA